MLAVFIIVSLMVDHVAAMSAPCFAGLAKCERKISRSKSLGGPIAARTVGTRAYRQPTSATVKAAEAKADLERALAWSAANDARGKIAARVPPNRGKTAPWCRLAVR
jgi:hypothetical protein